ncbi:hypothetical protein OSSY52_19040 [Tepiditoga spiralis]|uniref:Sigma-54 factor interaction domain-containing protein n=1 Tax=Tepiditoga spiralis TaxID=2108365 RepID=A0A7G1G9T3_9BACT|nr:sigma 54-interacting transcriptional regulator [Tepiditoga spiralis]BBE31763.1 hypothetical protein OSSY52_19040 [Tepiditoga spiralis]
MIYIEEEYEDLIKPIKNYLKKQFKSKEENIDISKFFTKEFNKCTIYIGNIDKYNKYKEEFKEIEPKKIILIIDKYLEKNILENFFNYNIIGVFRKNKLNTEYEEIGKLEKLLKNEIRKLTYTKLEKEDKFYIKRIAYKNIKNWKFNPEFDNIEEFYRKRKYISIFLDITMQKFSRQIRTILNDFYEFKENYENTKEKTFNVFPTLLIEGETGTGKSLIADIISDNLLFGETAYKFSLVNIEKNLIDSELFGYKKGAFTGADKDKPGRIVSHKEELIFLDEISEIPIETQTKLLLYFDDNKVLPEGSDGEPEYAPAFIICATNKNIKEEINKGNFRSDLYHRFKYKIKIPSLRERKEDIRFLINFILLNPFINKYDKENKIYKVDKISLEAIEKLENYDYPGNFRELESILREALNIAYFEKQDIILPKHINI